MFAIADLPNTTFGLSKPKSRIFGTIKWQNDRMIVSIVSNQRSDKLSSRLYVVGPFGSVGQVRELIVGTIIVAVTGVVTARFASDKRQCDQHVNLEVFPSSSFSLDLCYDVAFATGLNVPLLDNDVPVMNSTKGAC